MAVVISQTAKDLTRVRFNGKDWLTIVGEVEQYIQDSFGDELYNNLVADDNGIMMIEAFSYGLSTLSWFLDRQAGESFLETAELPADVSRLARLVGHKPVGAVPSTGNVEITLSGPQVFNVTVTRGTQLTGAGGKVYETNQDLVFLVGEVGPKTVGVTEGVTIEETFTSTGRPNQRFRLTRVPNGRFVAQGAVTVKVDNLEWLLVDFIDYERTNQVEINYTGLPPTARFGDGDAGNIPPTNAEIRITYRATLGVEGSSPATTITSFAQPIVANFQVISATVTNPNPTGVGSDPEAISVTRARAPNTFRAADRAVTDQDYTNLVESFVDGTYGAVAVGRAVISRSLEEDAETRSILQMLANQYGPPAADLLARLTTHWNATLSSSCKANLVSVQILQRDADDRLIPPNVGLAQALKIFLEDRKEVTQTISVTDGSINLFDVDTTAAVKVLEGFNPTIVLASVETVINDFLTSKRFGESVFISKLYDLIMETTGVDYVNLTFTAPVAKLDASGNVIIQLFEVVTLGTTTLTLL